MARMQIGSKKSPCQNERKEQRCEYFDVIKSLFYMVLTYSLVSQKSFNNLIFGSIGTDSKFWFTNMRLRVDHFSLNIAGVQLRYCCFFNYLKCLKSDSIMVQKSDPRFLSHRMKIES